MSQLDPARLWDGTGWLPGVRARVEREFAGGQFVHQTSWSWKPHRWHQEREATVGQSIALVTLVVRDYDEALAFFTDALRFRVVEDKQLGAGKRWVMVAPPERKGAALLLAKAASSQQAAHIGNQTGGRVFLFLETSDFWNDYRHMQSRGVKFAEEPRQEPYGTVAVFFDLYGNKWDLLERNDA